MARLGVARRLAFLPLVFGPLKLQQVLPDIEFLPHAFLFLPDLPGNGKSFTRHDKLKEVSFD